MADYGYNGSKPRRTGQAFLKQFSCIQDGMKEMSQLVPTIKSTFFQGENAKLLEGKMEDEDFTRGILNIIVDLFSSSFPSIMNEDYPNTYSLSIRGDMFFFRTKNRVSISWEYNTKEMDNGRIVLDMYIIFNEPGGILNANKIKTRQSLIDAGWVESDRRMKNKPFNKYSYNGNTQDTSITVGEKVNNLEEVYDRVTPDSQV